MKRLDVKAELQHEIGSLLTNLQDGAVNRKVSFGNFSCFVETFDHFSILRRDFETYGDSLYVPFSCSESNVAMIFSLDGRSFFNDRFAPFMLAPSSHCINFFKPYECTNLLDENARQHDITFILKKSFYADLTAQYLSAADEGLPGMIVREKAFNTINQHIPADAAVTGILQNILTCPFTGEMKNTFLREHVRALFTLQLFHFNELAAHTSLKAGAQISTNDREKLHAVKEYIDNHFLDPASLTSLCKDFGLNDFKLKHGFKSLFDTSPIKYLQYKRLSYALTQLRDTSRSIKEISYDIGYAHAANFTTAFLKTFGKPPHFYRSRMMQDMH